MASLSKRQETAQDLCLELHKLGGVVINSMPLDPDAKGLRVQILDTDRDKVITALCEKGWLPSLLQSHPRFTPNGLLPASLYQVDIPRERTTVPDDRPKVALSEPAKREKTPLEVEQMRRYLGWS
jgi:hypothetical protein